MSSSVYPMFLRISLSFCCSLSKCSGVQTIGNGGGESVRFPMEESIELRKVPMSSEVEESLIENKVTSKFAISLVLGAIPGFTSLNNGTSLSKEILSFRFVPIGVEIAEDSPRDSQEDVSNSLLPGSRTERSSCASLFPKVLCSQSLSPFKAFK